MHRQPGDVRPLSPLGAEDALQFIEGLAGAAVADPAVPVDAGDPLLGRQQQVGADRLVEVRGIGFA